MSKQKDEEKQDELSILLPTGKKVEIAEGLTATVFPMGFKHIRKFSGQLAKILTVIVSTVDIKELTDTKVAGRVLAQILPVIFEDMFDLVLECVSFNVEKFSVDDLPHWEAAPIIEAWVDESFGSKAKLLPWIGAIERTIARATGKDPSEVNLMEMLKDKKPKKA